MPRFGTTLASTFWSARKAKTRLNLLFTSAQSLESTEPTVAVLQREIRLSQERIRAMAGFVVASPADRRRPDTVLVRFGVVRRRCRYTGDVESRAAIV